MTALNKHHGNRAALVFECPKCGSAPGDMCTGAVNPPVYYATVHKAREALLEMPTTLEEWNRRKALVEAAVGKSATV